MDQWIVCTHILHIAELCLELFLAPASAQTLHRTSQRPWCHWVMGIFQLQYTMIPPWSVQSFVNWWYLLYIRHNCVCNSRSPHWLYRRETSSAEPPATCHRLAAKAPSPALPSPTPRGLYPEQSCEDNSCRFSQICSYRTEIELKR